MRLEKEISDEMPGQEQQKMSITEISTSNTTFAFSLANTQKASTRKFQKPHQLPKNSFVIHSQQTIRTSSLTTDLPSSTKSPADKSRNFPDLSQPRVKKESKKKKSIPVKRRRKEKRFYDSDKIGFNLAFDAKYGVSNSESPRHRRQYCLDLKAFPR